MIIELISLLLIIATAIYCFQLLLFFIGLFRLEDGNNKRRYSVSVVVAARNEEKSIRRCLSSLVNQDYPKERYEIIVVDDRSSDKTAEIVESFCQRFPQVKLTKVASQPIKFTPKKNALNLGISSSKGEIICTTDADCEVKPTWISGMIDYFESEVGMVVGFSQIGRRGENAPLLDKLQSLEFLSLMSAAAGTVGAGKPLSASGRNLAYRKQAFWEVGGFDKIGHYVSGDDVLLLQLIDKDTKWRIRFAKSAETFNTTQAERAIGDLINQRKRWASNSIAQLNLDRPFFGFLLTTFIMNLLLLFSIPFSLMDIKDFPAPIICLMAKVCFDFSVILRGAQLFQRLDLMGCFPILEVIDVPYKLIVGLAGTLGKFSWKGRDYSNFKGINNQRPKGLLSRPENPKVQSISKLQWL